MGETKTLCSSCTGAIWCETWGQYKCIIKERHITGRKSVCGTYTKRPSNWKEKPCQCEDCLKNPNIEVAEEET